MLFIFRSGLVDHLRVHGTRGACEAIERLVRQFPSDQSLKTSLAQAKAETRKRLWQPPTPAELFGLLSRSERRLVRDAGELLDLVTESLERLDKRLQAETPAAEFLWDKVPGQNVYRPKDECALSNWVKLHLESDLTSRGIVVNREVEVRRGEKTDIHIDAVARTAAGLERISVIIETKGSWNDELDSAAKHNW